MSNKRYLMVLYLGLIICLLAACSPVADPVSTTAPADSGDTAAGIANPVEEATRSEAPARPSGEAQTVSGGMVDTGQSACYDDTGAIPCPEPGEPFYGQDAQYDSLQPSYVDNGDGTITDMNTGLMWQQTPGGKVTYAGAVAGAEAFDLAGYDDWRLPTIKELYSLIDFSGSTGMSAGTSVPYIDTDYFDFEYGDTSAGERFIDAQYWSATAYVGTVFGDQAAIFGVNFADGRIKGYPRDTGPGGSPMTQFVRYVRGNPDYGANDFVDNGDGTITDWATGLMWQQGDSGTAMDWEGACSYCESLDYAGYDDWRLPNAKELQFIVDYTQAPDALDLAQQGPAIDSIFDVSEVESWFWTSTTHVEGGRGDFAVYIAFGQAFGVYADARDNENLVNVHGAGAQRSSPKSGDPADWAGGHGPQNDEIRIYNYVRCVRGGARPAEAISSSGGEPTAQPPAGALPSGQGQPPAGGPAGQPPEGAMGQPPHAAIDACSGLTQDAACSFTAPRAH